MRHKKGDTNFWTISSSKWKVGSM